MNKYLLPSRGQSPYARFFALFLSCFLYAASITNTSAQELIANGSMNGPTGQEGVLPAPWVITNSTPDLNDPTLPHGYSNSNTTNALWVGTPVASPNGGTFISVIKQGSTSTERFQTTITGLVVGKSYRFRYYWAATPMNIATSIAIRPNLFYTGLSGGTNPTANATAAWDWELVDQTLTATATTATISFGALVSTGANTTAYLSFDGASIAQVLATPVATGTNPTSPGTSTGSVSLTATGGGTPYAPSTPVSVTYTAPGGGTTVFTGTTDGAGKIVIPNLPAGQYGPFVVSVDGGPPSSPSNTVTLVDPAVPTPATPVATGTNPTSPGTATGSVSLSATGGGTPYAANTPVSVTYTTPGGGTATFTGTTNGSGVIVIPNLPAGQYGPFTVSVNGGPPSSPGGSATLVDPTPACAANAGTITRQ